MPSNPTAFAPSIGINSEMLVPSARVAAAPAARGVAVAAIALVAAWIRFWNLGAVFESSDQCAMAHMIHHSFGWRWIFAHDYGFTLPILQRGFSTLFSLAGIPSSEAACRFPVALVSLAQVLVSYPLLRRLGATSAEALFATLCVALVPTLVSDGHYAWGYLTVWLLTGTIALWAMVAWLDDQRPAQLGVAGIATFLHCLSNVFSVGLPFVLLVVWIVVAGRGVDGGRQGTEMPDGRRGSRRRLGASLLLGFVVPCSAALAVMVVSWRWTGQGQIGRLLYKQGHGALFGRPDQLLDLPDLWITQFGYVFGAIAAAGLVWGCFQLRRSGSRRLGLLSVWAVAAAFPLVLMTDWAALGYPDSYLGSYFIEVVYCAGLLGGVGMWRVLARLRAGSAWRMTALAGACVVMVILGAGTADECLFGGRLTPLTGVRTGWGIVRPDTGIKAAGLYVREYVPPGCVILTLHDNDGMEVPVAEYYLGRSVLAGYDLRRELFEPLIRTVGPDVDVLIVEPSERDLIERLGGFEIVCTLRRGAVPVRLIYARARWSLPRLNREIAALNEEYDRLYAPRHVPVALPAPPRFSLLLNEYQKTVRRLKTAARVP